MILNIKSFKDELERLKELTKECREDMHEPDEQAIYAEFGPNTYMLDFSPARGESNVVRTTFDNASTAEMSYDMGFWIIKREYFSDKSFTEHRHWFNLAVIVALARKASLKKGIE